MSTSFDETGPYVPLSERDHAKVLKDCRPLYQKWQKEAGKRSPLKEVVQDMKELCLHCVALKACRAEADAFWRCFKSIRGCGEYNGMLNCNEYMVPVERCTMPLVEQGLFEPNSATK
eukprot:TRINITY_DN27761_c0_g1_i1.p1 TRINITY_DN27761_c0_g1~~TRINITY_DN27761_c0_g1_i1.p1  ORF type:complete len:117 (+),score=16.87 TRINITY_DN27761_c0_g1_i1:40-390(+)